MSYKPINTNPGLSASTAYALMPTTNFAQKRADANATLQYEFLTGQLAKESVDEKQKAIADIQNTLASVDRANFLEMDKRRINDRFVRPFKEQEKQIFLNEYGADVARYQRERGGMMSQRLAKELLTHPDYQQAVANMTNYALAQEAKKKGQILQGDWETDWQNFANGKTERLNFAGAYEPPKEIWDYFDKNHKSGYEYGIYRKDPRTKRETYTAPEVTQDDLLAHLTSVGLSPEQATDYVGKIGYQGGRTWNVKTQSPWDARKQINDERHQRVQEGLQRQGLDLQRENAAEDRAYKEEMLKLKRQEQRNATGVGTTTINREIFSPDLRDAKPFRRFDGAMVLTPSREKISVMPFVGGDIGENVMQSAGLLKPRFKTKWDDSGGKWVDTDEITFPSALPTVVGVDGRKYHNKDNAPINFTSVDTSKLVYIPVRVQSAPDLHKQIPHLHAMADIDGRQQEVLIPIYDTPLVRANNARVGTFDSDERRKQAGSGRGLTEEDFKF